MSVNQCQSSQASTFLVSVQGVGCGPMLFPHYQGGLPFASRGHIPAVPAAAVGGQQGKTRGRARLYPLRARGLIRNPARLATSEPCIIR
jgi:hypothetical protein